ncbi:hypothetical protein AJ85_14075 [Alkalihalobacillus alcalophilus ATCC 27647 = CGMCC 1.3604]|uniref:Type II secretion system protein GspF domain-containing protein n=1 Tax=Alkalihalobacillus alcalophilus ATCC 27647 = CGMCC 1.3604 TaxID=1218173 RepID=A0A094XEW6_ALKAL|nr:hypothetical protein BALCAV_0210810 [Alkalihalobacillus alcalophilus ATCC 27647 = CGMCC 1.3604]THG89991.1 hypothetical protein AJ85_14075 [Alkalihalobacillus alcalophilus ATCC 27647 = CGMCC 1.3604]
MVKNRIRLRKNHQALVNQLARIAQLLEQGYPLTIALSFIKLHASIEHQQLYAKVEEDLKAGVSVSEAFEVFALPNDVLSFIYFYEQQGDLAKAFKQASDLYRKKEKTKKELSKILRYPLVLIWITVLMSLMLQQFIAPHLTQMFLSFQGTPPFITSLFFLVIDFMPLFSVSLIGTVFVIGIYYLYVIKKSNASRKMNLLLKIPLIKSFMKQILTYFFALQLGHLLESGMSVRHALSIFENQHYLSFFREEVSLIKSELIQGHSLFEIMSTRTFFMNELALVIENGERTGYLGKDLQSYSELLFFDLEDKIQKLFAMIQPAFFILMGGFVLFLFLAVMLPMFTLIGTLN